MNHRHKTLFTKGEVNYTLSPPIFIDTGSVGTCLHNF